MTAKENLKSETKFIILTKVMILPFLTGVEEFGHIKTVGTGVLYHLI